VIDSVSRWMGLLGRFQVLGGGLLVLAVLGIAVTYLTVEALPEPGEVVTPLVALGEMTMRTVWAIAAGLAVVGALVLRGGVLLTDAAEDLERIVHTDDLDQQHLEMALSRLRSFYRVELLLTGLAAAGAVAWAATVWT